MMPDSMDRTTGELPQQQEDGLYYPMNAEQLARIKSTFATMVIIYGRPSCGPTRKVTPKFKTLARQYRTQAGTVFVYNNVDEVAVEERDRDRKGLIRIPYFRIYSNQQSRGRYANLRELTMALNRF